MSEECQRGGERQIERDMKRESREKCIVEKQKISSVCVCVYKKERKHN